MNLPEVGNVKNPTEISIGQISPNETDEEDPNFDKFAKDEFEMIRSLRRTLKKRFKIIEVIGKGSYGCVSKAKCLQTGRIVALKVMKNQTQLEYEIIKLLREI